jgi:hypothetical protein
MPPEAVTEAVALFDGRPLPGVNLPVSQLDLFVRPWVARTGAAVNVHMRTRLYRLSSLEAPLDGLVRPGLPSDRPLLIAWVRDFLSEIGESVQDVEAVVDEALADEVVTLALSGASPASMVMRTLPSAGVVRIRYVFTPAALRGRGHAGVATAAACVSAGASEVVLFTDLDNPTSNGLYQRLGFRPVQDRTVVTFA